MSDGQQELFICTNCKRELPLSSFYKNKTKKNGIDPCCIECRKKKDNTPENKERRRIYDATKRDRTKQYAQSRRWKRNNQEWHTEYAREYYHKNREAQCEKMRRRRAEDVAFALKMRISSHVRYALKAVHSVKNNKTWKVLPYTPEELKVHLENQFDENMTWENHGTYWHVDHIIPLAALPHTSMDHPNFLKAWSLENLRPLEKIANIKKSSIYNGKRYRYREEALPVALDSLSAQQAVDDVLIRSQHSSAVPEEQNTEIVETPQ